MATNKELLDDVSFDTNIAPINQEGNLLISLLKNGAFNERAGILRSKYPVKDKELDRLISEGRVKMFSQSPMKIYLTEIGKIVACGELSIRSSENKKAN